MKSSDLQPVFLRLLIFLMVPIFSSASRHCSGNQITWVTKNNAFIKCSPCPPCYPGQQYSIPCNSIAVEGTIATCINCPRGTYSRKFDTKPCSPCRVCSKSFYLRQCTPHRNAKCGACKRGYYRSDVVFGCVECTKCCHDGHDVAALGCKEVGMCKYSSSNCPTKSTTPLPKGSTSPAKNTTTTPPPVPKTSVRIGWFSRGVNRSRAVGTSSLKTSSPSKVKSTPEDEQHLTSGEHSPTPTPIENSTILQHVTTEPEVSKTPLLLQAKEKNTDQKGSDYSVGFYIMVCVFAATFVALLIAVGFLKKERKNNKKLIRNTIIYSRSSSHEPTPMPNDMSLSYFMDNHPEECNNVCTLLFAQSSGGPFYYDLIACKFYLSEDDRAGLESVRHRGGNPTRELMEKLRAGDPSTTVRQFANKVESIGRGKIDKACKAVCKKLRPFLTVPSPQEKQDQRQEMHHIENQQQRQEQQQQRQQRRQEQPEQQRQQQRQQQR